MEKQCSSYYGLKKCDKHSSDYCRGATLLPCQSLLQTPPETEERVVLAKHLGEERFLLPRDTAVTNVHSWILRSSGAWECHIFPLPGVQAIPLPSISWSPHVVTQSGHGAKPGIFTWCQILIKGHRRRLSHLMYSRNISFTACSGRRHVCSRWHTCKKDGLNHLHWVTKIRLSGSW